LNNKHFGKLKQFRVHRLVAEAFIGSIVGKEIDHINRTRADNKVSNLAITNRVISKLDELSV